MRRSLRLKAQVDKLQENRDEPGWIQHREKVTHTLQIQSSITINLTGNFKGHAIVETYRNKISVDV